jgi:hypothetical protein
VFNTGAFITIGNYEFAYCCDVEIVNDREALTDTCKITLPRKYEWDLTKVLGDTPILKRKDAVKVQFGYDGKLTTEFIGFVKSIKSGVPVTIECEDYMMLLKDGEITETFGTNTTLRQVLDRIVPKGIKYVTLDDNVKVGDWRISKASPAQMLEELKSRFGFNSCFRLINDEPVLYVGWAFWVDNRKEEEFVFGKTIIDANNLEYKRKEDIRLKVKAISISGDNKRKEIEVGDKDGELRTVHYYKVDEATMKARAEKDMERFKYTGYHGSFETFGEPSIRANDVANLTGNEYHPSGKYLINKVTKKCGVTDGIKQTIEPSQIINANS